jgi:hypothetical protein
LPPTKWTIHRPSICLASIVTTTHWLPNSVPNHWSVVGFTAEDRTYPLHSEARSPHRLRNSATYRKWNIVVGHLRTKSTKVFLFFVAEISKTLIHQLLHE